MAITASGYELHPQPGYGETRRFEYARAATPPCMAAVAALPEVTDRHPAGMTPIQATLTTDALDALLCPHRAPAGDVRVTWTQDNHGVRVHADGVVEVTPPSTEGPSAT